MTTLLIVVGPQGSGNHLWSKILGAHSDVAGWDELQKTFWVGHDREPFAECWKNPTLLKDFDFSKSNYWVTSTSIPFIYNGDEVVPNLETFVKIAKSTVDCVKLAFLSRESCILLHQQTRLRGKQTVFSFRDQIKNLVPDIYLSYEALYFYRHTYLESISKQLEFPVDVGRGLGHLIDNANSKYIIDYKDDEYWVDNLAKQSSSKWK